MLQLAPATPQRDETNRVTTFPVDTAGRQRYISTLGRRVLTRSLWHECSPKSVLTCMTNYRPRFANQASATVGEPRPLTMANAKQRKEIGDDRKTSA